MKILYVTAESVVKDPIINSQVIPLIDAIGKEYEAIETIDLITYEDDITARCSLSRVSVKRVHYKIRNNGILRNIYGLISLVHKIGFKYDIVHVRSYLPMPVLLIFKKIFKYKLIFDPRGLFADELTYYGKHIYIASVIKRIEKYLFLYSDYVITVSRKFSNYISNRYQVENSRIRQISTFGVREAPIENYSSNTSLRDRLGWKNMIVLCYSGSTEGWQLVNEIIDIFKIASDLSNKFRFAIVSKEVDRFKRLLEPNLSEDLYTIMSAKPGNLSEVLSEFDYGILIRRDHIINAVSAPIKFKDYLFAGLRVIITDNIGDSSDYISRHDCGHVIKSLERDSIDNMIKKLYKPTLKEKKHIVQTARMQYDIQNSISQYGLLYTRMLIKS